MEVAASSTTPPGPRPFTLAFTGDTLMHRPLVNQARRNAGDAGYDFAPMFARVAPLLAAADLAVCHLETPVAPPGEELSTFPYYGVPPEVATGLASAGYDRCSTASNHTIDRGVAGVDATLDALASAGVAQSGMARTPEEVLPAVFDVAGTPVAHLSYTFSFNGLRLPEDQPWRSNLIDPAKILADVDAVRAAGARFVIVSCHWGTEGSSAITTAQFEWAAAITAPGTVDLVVGHHAHVLQPIQQVNGVWVVFGLGNFISNFPTGDSWPAASQDGAIARLTVTPSPDGTLAVGVPDIAPTWVDIDNGWVIHPVIQDLADPAIDERLRARLEESLTRTRRVVGDFVPAG